MITSWPSAVCTGVLCLALAGVARAGDDREQAPPSAQPPAPPTRAGASGERGHWGLSGGIKRVGGVFTWDFRNASTPRVPTSGPYPTAIVTLDHDFAAPYVAFGYRGPMAGSRVGIAVEAQIAVAVQSPPDANTTVTSPAGVRVTFGSGGIDGFGDFAGVVHVSYAVAPALSVYGGAAVSTMLLKAPSGGYVGSVPPGNNNPYFYFAPPGPTPQYYDTALVPRVGAEVVLGHRAGLDLAADFEPTRTIQLTSSPIPMTFARHGVALTAAIRFTF
jgi:hypothetical protein